MHSFLSIGYLRLRDLLGVLTEKFNLVDIALLVHASHRFRSASEHLEYSSNLANLAHGVLFCTLFRMYGKALSLLEIEMTCPLCEQKKRKIVYSVPATNMHFLLLVLFSSLLIVEFCDD